jgi:GntR family transcriptional regulator/MocR family aminotransferase
LKESRRILDSNQPTPAIPFQHGLSAIASFPIDVWVKLTNRNYYYLQRNNFGYGEPAGYSPLRHAVANYLNAFRAVKCNPEQVIITNGAQHAFDLIGRVCLAPKTDVLMEDPGYVSARQAFQSFGATIIPVRVDANGFDLDSALSESRNARLAYVTPSHQFPLGVTMSLSRRLQLLEWAKRANAWIVEDDYDSEFRYEGRPLPSLQGIDQDGRVFYIGTFSKTIFAALRLGCLVVPPDLIDIFAAVRALNGLHSPLIAQATLAAFIDEGHFTRHIRRMRKLYRERQEILVSECEKLLAGKIDVKLSESGMHLIGWLNEGVDDRDMSERAASVGIKAASLSSFSFNEVSRGGLILGYTSTNEKQIKQGVKKLAQIFVSNKT